MKTLIGLEIHAQLATKTKMFCGCSNVTEGVEPNVNVCPICLGLPGSLPVTNQHAVELAIMTGSALGSTIAQHSKFDRKNYFYPDLPKGYQISQYDEPICLGGALEITTPDGLKKVRLIRIHMEEDAAKATHPAKTDYSLIDFNRAGTPLIETVTEPDMSTPQEARQFVQQFRNILRTLHVSHADMEKGQLRCDANINVIAADGRKTPITEIKNMNSFRSIERALTYEIERHTTALEAQEEEKMIRETRGWLDDRGETVPQRSKEEMSDYRYFPEPDLPPLEPDKDFLQDIRKNLPELPRVKAERFVTEYKLSTKFAEQLANDSDTAAYFEAVVSELEAWVKSSGEKLTDQDRFALIKGAANWILVELAKHLNKASLTISQVRITPEDFAEFLKMVHRNEVNSSAAQLILADMFLNGSDPSTVAQNLDLIQISDAGALETIADKVIAANPKPVADVKAGKGRALQFLVGLIMKETKGKANPKIIQELLQKKLK